MSDNPQFSEARTPPPLPGLTGLASVLRSLRNPNYRLFFFGQGLSLIGTWMQGLALQWMVFALAKSAQRGSDASFLLGVVGFTSQIPTFLVAPFAGALAQHWDRKKVLVTTQAFSMLQASLLAMVAFAPTAAPGSHGLFALTADYKINCVIALSALLGVINGFDIPLRQSFVVEMVDRREDLSNAIALNSTLFNGARLIGPAIAGVLVATFGEAACFTLNAVSYLAVILALLAMRVRPRIHRAQQGNVLHSLKEGLVYTFQFAPIRSVLLLLAAESLFGFSYGTLMPIFANDLKSGPQTLGLLVSAAGAGALLGALYLASRRNVRGLEWWIAVGPAILGVGAIGFAWSATLWLSAALLVVTGFSVMVQMGSSNMIVQTLVDDDKRTRVMSFHTMAFMGTAPLGALLAGRLAKPDAIGPRFTVTCGGLICVVAAAVFFTRLPKLRRVIHPIYDRMGIVEAGPAIPSPTDSNP